MRLAAFITANTEPILTEWVEFAKSCGPAGDTMDLGALRDHALAMLKVIVVDLETPQSDAEQVDKSRGNATPAGDEPETAAEVHGAGRAESGFTVGEMVSEYRALRASVIRLWTEASGSLQKGDIDDLMRFNEAIDQALAESITRYTQDIDRSREMFIAILGHDLRTPLGAVITGAQFMLDTGELAGPQHTLVERIARSGRRMSRMVSDLLDFTRGRLGSGVPITRAEMDLAAVVRGVVEEVQDANPGRRIQFTATGALVGRWDAARLGQVISNLLGNAVQHGDPASPISVSAQGESADVIIRLHNLGPEIPASAITGLFSPFKRVDEDTNGPSASTSLGLGLYIVERIVTAHGGSIDVRSSPEAGTLFTVRLPR